MVDEKLIIVIEHHMNEHGMKENLIEMVYINTQIELYMMVNEKIERKIENE
jgi:hypothetical protein